MIYQLPADASATFDMDLTEAGADWAANLKRSPRDITLTLGYRVPDALKKGQRVDLQFNVGIATYYFPCRVLRRRLNRVWLREVL